MYELQLQLHNVDYKSFDSILCSNKSQKNQEISIQYSSNDVKMLYDHEDYYAEFLFTW